MKHIKILKICIYLVMVVSVTCGIAAADIAIAPLTKTVQMAAGKTETVIYQVANEGDSSITLNISAKTWFTLPENAGIDIDQWLALGTDKVILGPHKKKEVSFEIRVPKGAKGELAAMIYFAPEREIGQMLGTSYGVSLYVFVKGTEIVEPAIGDLLITRRDNSYYLAVTIENRGNIHFRPSVNAVVKAGDEFEEDVVLPFGKPIFGGQSYTFAGKIKGQLPEKGKYLIDLFCDYGSSADTVLKKRITLNAEEVVKE